MSRPYLLRRARVGLTNGKGIDTYQTMERAYENDCAPVRRPMMVLSAAEDLVTCDCQLRSFIVVSRTYPMLINASKTVIESDARIEFSGIGVPNVVT